MCLPRAESSPWGAIAVGAQEPPVSGRASSWAQGFPEEEGGEGIERVCVWGGGYELSQGHEMVHLIGVGSPYRSGTNSPKQII